VLSEGAPQAGVTVNFRVAQGSGSLRSATAVTNNGGYATDTLSVTNFTGNVQVAACVAQGSPCQTISGNAVGAAQVQMQPVAGAGQVVMGKVLEPFTVRLTDSSIPPNPVLGESVMFQATLLRPAGNGLAPGVTQSGMPVVLSVSQNTLQSDGDGLVSFVPSLGGFTGTLEVDLQVSAGAAAFIEETLEAFAESGAGNGFPAAPGPGTGKAQVPRLMPELLRMDDR
jgi:hypothetical protein